MTAQPELEAPVDLIATHGYGDSAAVWSPLSAALAAVTRVPVNLQAWDLPGHGARRAELPRSHDIDTATEELRRRARQCPRPPVLLGHSLGGYLSLRCALTADVPLRAIVVVSSGPGFRDPQGRAGWNAAMDRLTIALGLSAETSAIAHMTDGLVLERLPAGRIPALVVRGAADRPQYQAGAAVIGGRWPGAQLIDVPGAGHEPHRTHPADVAAAIARFLELN